MKTFLLTFCAAFVFSFAHAQITKGTVLLGGGFGFGSAKFSSDARRSSGFSLSPVIGFAVKPNRVLGIRAGYGSSKSYYSVPNSTLKTRNRSAGVFWRPYLPLGKSFYLFGEADALYNHSTTETNDQSGLVTRIDKGSSLEFFPGISYVVNRKIHLEVALNDLFSISYITSENRSSSAPAGNYKFTSFGAGVNFNPSAPVTIGFRIALGS